MRLQSPLVTFRPSAIERSTHNSSTNAREDRFLPSGVLTSVNLLESLKDEPGLNGVQPRLPASRLSRINTTYPDLKPSDRKLSITAQPTFPVMPAITARVRYFKASNIASKHAIIASLDIETTSFFDNEITLQKVVMRLSEGSAEDLGHGFGPMLPMTCRPRDNPTFLFRLIPNDTPADGTNFNSNSKSLDIQIDAVVLASETSQPRIEMRWRTGVDFSTALNPSFGAPNQPLQRNKRPANIAMTQAVSTEVGTPGPGQGRDEEDVPREKRAALTNDLGITMTFTAPREVYVGEPFSWDVFVVNRSNKPRKLAILVVPKRRRADTKTHLSRPSTSSTGGRKNTGMADAVTDENLLYAMQRNGTKEALQLISLSNDIIIGYVSSSAMYESWANMTSPLHPGSCFNSDLKFLPLASGYLQIEAIRIVDIATNDAVDVRDLPDIIAQERSTEKGEGMGD